MGPEVRVGLYVERSLEMVVGAAGHPQGRRRVRAAGRGVSRGAHRLHAGGCRRRPCSSPQSALVDRLPEHAAEVVRLDSDWSADRARKHGRAGERRHRRYAGVRHLHVRIHGHAQGRAGGAPQRRPPLPRDGGRASASARGTCWTLFHSHAFDFSVWEIWGALLYGGRAGRRPLRRVARSPPPLTALLVDEGVTVLNQTPSAFQHLVARGCGSADAAALALRPSSSAGEALEPAALRPLVPAARRRAAPARQHVRHHGDDRPRDVRPLSVADVEAGGRSLIGAPLADLRLCVLDRDGAARPRGVPGELYVGGARRGARLPAAARS